MPILTIDATIDTYHEDISFKITFENVSNGKKYWIEVRHSDSNFVYSKKFPEGEYHMVEYEPTSGVNGQIYKINSNKNLIVKRGAISVCPYKFSIVTYKNKHKNNGVYIYSDISEVKPEQITLIEQKLQTEKNYSQWIQ